VMRRIAVMGVLAALALAGCGSDHGTGDGSYDPRDSRITCLTGKGLQAKKVGDRDVYVVGPRPPLRILFAVTPGEAEALSVSARAEGAEQLGRALLFVGNASESLLTKIEGCLDDN
jgi:hypothetical protein